MAVTHSAAARNAATDAVVDLLDEVGSPHAPAKLVFRLAGTIAAPGAAVATLTMASPNAFGNSAAGVATAGAITSDTNAAGNAAPVANASLQTAGGVLVVHCAVAASASDINVSNGLVIAAGDTLSCSSLTYSALSA